ncbi:MAG TPA: CotH kinase family protein [Blastocatellia bacterium]|nr:CotH kinase family protein [Blastocatellia bacterium]
MRSKNHQQKRYNTLRWIVLVITFLIMTTTRNFAQTERGQTERGGSSPRPTMPAPVPLTWQDDYFPEFRIRIKEADLEPLLNKPEIKGSETKYPMTLTYQGKVYEGTIRQRVPSSSSAANKKQFRLDFPKRIAFPDGYIADRFETDHGNGFTLNEWLAWKMLNVAAQKRPNLKILRKKANVVAIYLNDKLYHVQTLVEDVNKDLLEPQLGTRKLNTYKYGCLGRTGLSPIDNYCATFSPLQLQGMMDIPSFMYATAAVQTVGGYDNYPRFPNNFYLVEETETGRIWFMPDDMDTTICPYDTVYSDPFQIAYSVGDSQRHFTEMLKDRACIEMYYSYVQELCSLWEPEPLNAAIAKKYAQVRSTLFASGGLPYDEAYYDYLYNESLPLWIDMRYQYLTKMMQDTSVGEMAKKVASQP